MLTISYIEEAIRMMSQGSLHGSNSLTWEQVPRHTKMGWGTPGRTNWSSKDMKERTLGICKTINTSWNAANKRRGWRNRWGLDYTGYFVYYGKEKFIIEQWEVLKGFNKGMAGKEYHIKMSGSQIKVNWSGLRLGKGDQ